MSNADDACESHMRDADARTDERTNSRYGAFPLSMNHSLSYARENRPSAYPCRCLTCTEEPTP